MPVIPLRRPPRPLRSRAAIQGSTRALIAAYPVFDDEPMSRRLALALVVILLSENSASSPNANSAVQRFRATAHATPDGEADRFDGRAKLPLPSNQPAPSQ
jgi:hypothetical protein